ncbi:hypothetical protein CK203_103930 [Vitis vinifera]|uniref:Uncharacterized protein n=1 Tax=Vitis vinifera TaxID=29760 RepID=A0A438CUI0_VITVI|nr:hypothetical protein CK203_103930 [Vitis vinifera]
MGCRPVLAIDSCHLSGPYKGALLSAIAYDADDGMFPLALGVVGSENYEDWQNIRGKKGKEDALLLLDNIAYARLDIDYNEAFEKLVRFNGDLARWVVENSPEHWAMSKFLKKRWDKMTTNIAESFNAWLREERHQTIYTLLMMHMDKLVAMLDTHMRVIILTMAGNGLDGSAASSLPLSGTSLQTRCSAARFKKLCNRLPEEKIQAIRDLQFGGLLNLNCTEVRHNICIFLIQHFNVGFRRIEFSAQKHYPLTATDVGLIFGLPTEGRILHVTSTSTEHPFGTIRACEERLLDLPVGEEFRRAFIYYACATLLAPRLGSMVALHYVIKFQIPSVQVPIIVPPALPWTDDMIKRRLVAEIKEFGAFRHAEIDLKYGINIMMQNEQSTNINGHSAAAENNAWPMHKLGTRRHSG